MVFIKGIQKPIELEIIDGVREKLLLSQGYKKYDEIPQSYSDAVTQAEVDSKPTYQELRKAEYPPIEDYVDAVVKDDLEGIQDYKNKCLAVKAKYPK